MQIFSAFTLHQFEIEKLVLSLILSIYFLGSFGKLPPHIPVILTPYLQPTVSGSKVIAFVISFG